mmetsp:Transcript_20312/g.29377  ORF Transcript_20312/g.29377 Transcript_20312/m.29377 type:complete len:198 (+) Transcript_20312:10-603(+)
MMVQSILKSGALIVWVALQLSLTKADSCSSQENIRYKLVTAIDDAFTTSCSGREIEDINFAVNEKVRQVFREERLVMSNTIENCGVTTTPGISPQSHAPTTPPTSLDARTRACHGHCIGQYPYGCNPDIPDKLSYACDNRGNCHYQSTPDDLPTSSGYCVFKQNRDERRRLGEVPEPATFHRNLPYVRFSFRSKDAL